MYSEINYLGVMITVMNKQNVHKPVTVITGAANGLGKALSIDFFKAGHRLALLDICELDEVIKELESLMPSIENDLILSYKVDVTNQATVTMAIQSAYREFGRLDILINNAGIGIPGGSDIDPEDFERQIMVNLTGSFYCVHAIAPIFKQQRFGYIFNVSSMAAKFVKANRIGLGTSKLAMLGMNEALFREMVEYGVKVTALVPHYFGEIKLPGGGQTSIDAHEAIPLSDLFKTLQWLLSLSLNAAIKEVVIECTAVIRNQNNSEGRIA
ncbi:SDR family oxidoreductase [Cysteiniphilum halobium]|uniref:SDR family oxidoreductase n=1 Tax=Cysteiniphilum halobium TaxID=2219059 RepID=UPI003F86C5E2